MEATPIRSLASDLVERSQNSLFFTATALLGYNKLTPHFHYEMCRVLEMAEDYKRVLILVPRDHYKSTIGTIAYSVWRGIRNPNDCGMIIGNNFRNAAKFVGMIRNHWETKALLRNLYPHLRPELSTRWNREEACLPRTEGWPEATWTPAGWDSRVTSQKGDYLIFDDVVDEETYESPELMAKLEARFEQREGLLRPPIQDHVIIVIMNHWSPIDLACRIIEKHPEYMVYYRQAIENGSPLFPEAYTMKWLLAKQKQDPYTFANQWMNNPVDRSVTEMRIEWLQEYKRGENSLVLPDGEIVPLGYLNIYGLVDPRHSLATTAGQKLTSRNAVTINGIDHKRRRYQLDEWASRSGPEDLLKKMLEFHKRWHPIKFGIESYGFQAALKPLAEEIWKNEPEKPRLHLLQKDTTRSKETRIRGSLRFFPEGLGYIHKSHLYFKEEYITFPHGRTRDILDCWAWAQELMNPPSSIDDWALERAHDQQHLKRLHPVTGI